MKSKPAIDRILFIAPEMEARGTNEYVLYLGDALQRRGFEVGVYCSPGPMIEVFEKKDIKATTFEYLTGCRVNSRQRENFLAEIDQFSPDIVHAPSLSALKSYKKLAEDYSVARIVTIHSAPARPRVFRSVSQFISGIIVTSQKVREELVNDFKFPKSKIVMISNGTDFDELNSQINQEIFTRPVPVIGSVGPVEKARGHELFVKAAALFIQSGKNAQFVIAGEGEEIPKLSNLGSKLGLDKCLTFVRDFASYHEVLEALDIVVQSSQVDVSGFSMLDAMGSGRPVVAFNTGTACEIIKDEQNGLIVPKDDENALANALIKLVNDPQWGRALGQRAKENIKDNFNIRKNVEAIVDFYQQILLENE